MADFLWSTLESIPSPLRTNIPLLISRLDSPLTLPQNLTNPLLLQHLSRLLTIPALTRHIADIARPLLLDLCARWIDDESIGEFERFEAIAFLIGVHREIYPILLEFIRRPSLQRGPLASPSITTLPTLQLHRLLLSYYRILHVASQLPSQHFWPCTPLFELCSTHPDRGVRLLAIHCYVMQLGIGEAARKKMEQDYLGERGKEDCTIYWGEELINGAAVPKEVDGWVLLAKEVMRVEDWREQLPDPVEFFDAVPHLTAGDLCPRIANIEGIFLFVSSPTNPHAMPHTLAPSPLVLTPTASTALRAIALHIAQSIPLLLTSLPTSGKSLFLSHLSSILFPSSNPSQIITIHLSDTSLDARSLLGSLITSPTSPGKFEWIDGLVTRALREGKWLVLKDIDKASQEVLGVLLPLVESLRVTKGTGERAFVDAPNRSRVEAQNGFALFATRSVISTAGTIPAPTFLGHTHWNVVIIPAPTQSEQLSILSSRFPRLSGDAIRSLLDLWDSIREGGVKGRGLTFKDIEKWVIRVESLLPSSFRSSSSPSSEMQLDVPSLSAIFPNLSLREEIFLEAYTVFFASSPSPASQANSLMVVAEKLGLTLERTTSLIQKRVPEFEVVKSGADGSVSSVLIGRTRLTPRLKSSSSLSMPDVNPVTRPYALHRPSLTLLEQIALSVQFAEPLLLVGETGTGKTSSIQHLSSLLSYHLTVLNLSTQTESADLLGGFKPVDARTIASGVNEKFKRLFEGSFSLKKNEEFLEGVGKALVGAKWKRVVGMWREARGRALERIMASQAEENANTSSQRKRRKIDQSTSSVSESDWDAFAKDVSDFEAQYILGKTKFAFSFVEGPLIKALRSGHWVLLDEINLAAPETLEAILPLLQSPTSSLTLTELGSSTPIPRHPAFRIFASMNPATDVGKKDLPHNLRSRFTEIWVPPPDADRDALLAIIQQYIGHISLGSPSAILDVAEFYEAIRKLAEDRKIADGSNKKPHFSMRTLTRALTFAVDVVASFGLRRALWEGCLMAFSMVLDEKSAEILRPIMEKHLFQGAKSVKALLSQTPRPPSEKDAFVQIGLFYLVRGPLPPVTPNDYILTPSVQTKLINLSRIVLTRRFPVLIEGPTSSGKTSAVEYLAQRTGHRFVRINNHEHTDLQEYIGTYVSDPQSGKLVFQDGILVRALRRGDWIVLDELNLAPTDVLEALNRLLDDNRELFIPETNEIIRPHPNFMLFATQNPPGLYGGRKILSRAFRNRFLEVHFDDVPQAELETILCDRCQIAPSYGQRIVAVFLELQKRRQVGRIFESKHGFATLRDLFRWATRDAVGYQQLAENGYMLLAERTRRTDDKAVVKEVIESIMKVRIDESTMYNVRDGSEQAASAVQGILVPSSSQIVWTSAMQRLYALVFHALKNNEPVLLVGETGAGKTSVCELVAEAFGKHLYTVNCHQNTETADLLGGQRPIRNRTVAGLEALAETRNILQRCDITSKLSDADSIQSYLHFIDRILDESIAQPDRDALREVQRKLQRANSLFEWHDGPLIEAMRGGAVFLLDEISLADDSVLERLNSVLEPARTLVLAEKGGWDVDHVRVVAEPTFQLLATMNPGGDFGKKELSPALRNRFTEIWVPQIDEVEDRLKIVQSTWRHPQLQAYGPKVTEFCSWLGHSLADGTVIGLRDVLAWVHFSNEVFSHYGDALPPDIIFRHAAHMTFMDGLQSLPQTSSFSVDSLDQLYRRCVDKLQELAPLSLKERTIFTDRTLSENVSYFSIGPFHIRKGNEAVTPQTFTLDAPTPAQNALRLVRACQLAKPILLEGSPGVGKTSLVTALAGATGHRLCRINLSDQTDIVDLFGADLPVEGGKSGEFVWRDAAFLRALQEGDWVLLDEMNLAPQPILEGLNAVLDHRGTVYIPELGKSFARHPDFRIFAAQNPIQQGGGRKGLPKSFLNRFTKVYLDELSQEDLFIICTRSFPGLDPGRLHAMIEFSWRVQNEVMVKRTFGQQGTPWEFNLRDVFRWGTLMSQDSGLETQDSASEHFRSIFQSRFRTGGDRDHVARLYTDVFGSFPTDQATNPWPSLSSDYCQIGHTLLHVKQRRNLHRRTVLLQSHLQTLEAASSCLQHGWLVILSGPSGGGKTAVLRLLADLAGRPLQEVSMSSATDTMDLLGSFEQVDVDVRLQAIVQRVLDLGRKTIDLVPNAATFDSLDALQETLLRWSSSGLPKDTLLSHSRATLESIRPQYDPETALSVLKQIEDFDLSDAAGLFEWIDGPLVRAMKNGEWLLLDNANLCNPSVLDRLNSLCETNGSLALAERGLVDGEIQILQPHPSFRLVMVLDPRHGELSRAMRNRGVEIALIPCPTVQDRLRLQKEALIPSRIAFPDKLQLENYALLSQLNRRSLIVGASETPSSSIYMSPPQHDSPARAFFHQIAVHRTQRKYPYSIDAATFHWLRSNSTSDSSIYRRYANILSEDFSLEVRPPLLSLIDNLASHPLMWQLEETRERARRMRNLPQPFFSDQPIDLRMNPNLIRYNPDDPHLGIIGANISQVLDLFVRLYIMEHCEEEADKLSLLSQSRSACMSQSGDVDIPDGIKAIYPLIAAVHSAANVIFRRPDLESETGGKDIAVVGDLLDYAAFLHKIALTSSFDFSAMSCIAAWFSKTLENNGSALYSTIIAQTRVFCQSLHLKSGHGMTELWKACLPSERTAGGELVNLDGLCATIDASSPQLTTARSHALDLMSMASLKTSSRSDYEDIQKLTIDLEKYVSSFSNTARVCLPKTGDATALALAELNFLRILPGDPAGVRMWSQSVWRLACHTPHYALLRVVGIKRLEWILGNTARASLFTLLPERQISWFSSLWSASLVSKDDVLLGGPALLFRPSSLCHLFELRDPQSWALGDAASFESKLNRLSIFTESQTKTPVLYNDAIVDIIFQLILTLVETFKASFPSGASSKLLSCYTEHLSASSDMSGALAAVIRDLLASSDSVTLQSIFRGHILPVIDGLHVWPSEVDQLTWMGVALIRISKLIFELYLPNIPLDPVAAQLCHLEFLRGKETRLRSQIELCSISEETATGNRLNRIIEELQLAVEAIEKAIADVDIVEVSRKPDVPRLLALFTEINNFRSLVLTDATIDLLQVGLPDNSDPILLQKEQLVQESISNFLHRLTIAYPDYHDLVQPFTWGILQLRFGLRVLARVAERKAVVGGEELQSISERLLRFPAIASAQSVAESLSVSTAGSKALPGTPAEWSMLELSAIVFEIEAGVDINNRISTIRRKFNNLFGLWVTDREKEARLAEEAQSLYRRRKVEDIVLSDHELEEKEFSELFPDFQDVLSGNSIVDSSQPPRQTRNHFPIHLFHDLWRAHTSLFGSSSGSSGLIYYRARTSVLSKLIPQSMAALSGSLDQTSLAYRISLLSEMRHPITRRIEEDKPPDFYGDPNVPQTRIAARLVTALRSRLEELIAEWPDQMVLHNLRSKCGDFLKLPIASSMAKVLSALEQLLMATDEWENYSNRDNTLKSHQNAFASLIVEWRRLELSCWAQLLETQALTFAHGVSEWWMRLYEAGVSGMISSLDATDTSGIDAHLQQLAPLLDQFIHSAPLGQFAARMELIWAFSRFLSLVSATETGEMGQALVRTSRVFHSTHSLYSSFQIKVSASLKKQREPIEKDIRDIIKLASWKDVNVYALKQSAQRTHRQLHRCVRKFRDVLRQPVASFLASGADDGEQEHVQNMPGPQSSNFGVHPADLTPGVLVSSDQKELPRTLSRFRAILGRARPSLIVRPPSSLDELSIEIIGTSRSLSAAVNIDPKPSTAKSSNNLLMRKRKAWADLMKELKRIGLSSNIKPEVEERQHSRRWIMELEEPSMSLDSPASLAISKIEHYHTRLIPSMTALRESLSGHHSDISTRDLQRGINFVESSLYHGLEARSLLVKALKNYHCLDAISKRLAMIGSAEATISSLGNDLTQRVASLFDIIVRTIAALKEILLALDDYSIATGGTKATTHEISLDLQNHIIRSQSIRCELSLLHRRVNATPVGFLLLSETELVEGATDHIFSTIALLDKLAAQEPKAQHLFAPVSSWLRTIIPDESVPELSFGEEERAPDFSKDTISALLTVAQSLLERTSWTASAGDELDDGFVRVKEANLRDFFSRLASDRVSDKLVAFFDQIISSSTSSRYSLASSQHAMLRVHPFLQAYVSILRDFIIETAQWGWATMKFTYVVCSTVRTIAEKGFCRPPDADDAGESDKRGKESDGTGLGEGSGTNNVSEEIEDESQVEGLRGEADDPTDNTPTKQESTAIEMSEDIGGEMEDVNPEEDVDEEKESDDEPEPEDRIGDVDPMAPDAVDEKLWGDEHGPEDDPSDQHTTQDHSTQKPPESDTVAKKGDSTPKKPEEKPGDTEGKGVDDEMADDDDGKQDLPDLDEDRPDLGAQMDDYVPEADTLDLPEELSLDQDEERGQEKSDDDLGEEDFGDVDLDESAADGADGEHRPQDAEEDAIDPLTDEAKETQEDVMGSDGSHEADDDRETEQVTARPDIGGGNDGDVGATPEDTKRASDPPAVPKDNGKSGRGLQHSSEDQLLNSEQNDSEGNPPNANSTQLSDTREGNDGAGNSSATVPAPSSNSEPSPAADPLNPIRSLGDALKEFRRRLEQIQERSSAESSPLPRAGDNTTEPSNIEYLADDEEDYDMQALGPAGEEEVSKLRDLKIDYSEAPADTEFMDVDDAENAVDPDVIEQNPSSLAIPHQPAPSSRAAGDQDIPSALTKSQVQESRLPSDNLNGQQPSPDAPRQLRSEEDTTEFSNELELRLQHWQSAPDERSFSNAQDLWHQYSSLTSQLSYSLCEQLRLVLEPTLASRLKGDYRTGKRLNMKKIIPYIASEFTKDKIWMRRTRPSKREYQVLIALDDSKSMKESRSVHLAYQTLALVCNALSKLEVGDIAIAKFGQSVDLVHGFDQQAGGGGSFSDVNGAEVMRSFNFAQGKTDVLKLVQRSLDVLSDSRERMSSKTGAELWQLELIISDGICQDQEALRSQLRRATEQRVMIVFIIIDSLHQHTVSSSPTSDVNSNSILSMKQATYKMSSSGRMEVMMERYLDNFPFEYYVVLRDVDALPEVLSGTLRQFFERIVEE